MVDRSIDWPFDHPILRDLARGIALSCVYRFNKPRVFPIRVNWNTRDDRKRMTFAQSKKSPGRVNCQGDNSASLRGQIVSLFSLQVGRPELLFLSRPFSPSSSEGVALAYSRYAIERRPRARVIDEYRATMTARSTWTNYHVHDDRSLEARRFRRRFISSSPTVPHTGAIPSYVHPATLHPAPLRAASLASSELATSLGRNAEYPEAEYSGKFERIIRVSLYSDFRSPRDISSIDQLRRSSRSLSLVTLRELSAGSLLAGGVCHNVALASRSHCGRPIRGSIRRLAFPSQKGERGKGGGRHSDVA
jgi:hypothetical protein